MSVCAARDCEAPVPMKPVGTPGKQTEYCSPECSKRTVSARYYEQNRERLLARQRERHAQRMQDPDAKAQWNARRGQWRADNVERVRAVDRARYARDPQKAMSRTLAWRTRNPEAAKRAARKTELKRVYGLTEAEYAHLMANTPECPICHTPFAEVKRWVLDHDHSTGVFRGPLCGHCNSGLGMFRDDPYALARAISYLARFEEEVA